MHPHPSRPGRPLKGDGIEMVTLESTSGSAPSDFHR
jgi:hypothetical protein